MSAASAVALHEVSHAAEDGAALCEMSADFAPGAFHLVRGGSCAVRSLLLRLLGLMMRPDRGEVLLRGQPTRDLGEDARGELRSRQCGFVFATPFLLAEFTVLENVAMPLFKVSQVGPAEARRRSEAALDFTGLAAAASSPAAGLPLDAQFRVALARALVNEPAVLLVENPDADLAALLRSAAERYGACVIATASHALPVEAADRVLDLDAAVSETLREP